MKSLSLFLALFGTCLLLAQPLPVSASPPVKIILDVDLAEDVDNAGAMATLHALANCGEAEILHILISSKNKWSACGGTFPYSRFRDAQGEYNFMCDTVASVRAVNDWRTPVVFSGFAIGDSPLGSFERIGKIPQPASFMDL